MFPSEHGPRRERSAVTYRFGGFTLDEASRQLLRADGTEVEMPGRAFDLLVELARRQGEVATRQALLDAVWGDAEVTDAALSQTISLVRRALGPDGRVLIRTVAGHGYRLERCPSREAVSPEEVPAAHTSTPAPTPPVAAAPAVDVDPVQPAAVPAATRPAAALADGLRLAGPWMLALAVFAAALGWVWREVPPSPLPTPGPRGGTQVALLLDRATAERDAWLLDAVRGVLATGLGGNVDVTVLRPGQMLGSGPREPRLLGRMRTTPSGVPRVVVVDWTLQRPDGGPARWTTRASSDRLFDLLPQLEGPLRRFLPGTRVVRVGEVGGALPEAALRHFAAGMRAETEEEFDVAARHFEAALTEAPGALLVRLQLANALYETGFNDAAMSHVKLVEPDLARQPGTAGLALHARALGLARRFDDAAAVYDRLLAVDPGAVGWRLRGAQAHAFSGASQRALQILAAIDQRTLTARAEAEYQRVLGIALQADGQFGPALDASRRYAELARQLRMPTLIANAELEVSQQFYGTNEMDAAIAAARRAVEATQAVPRSRYAFNARHWLTGLLVRDERPLPDGELERLLEVARASGSVYREGLAHFAFANDAYSRLRVDQAIAHRIRALALFERAQDRMGIDTALQSLFALERIRGNKQAALRWHERLLRDRAHSGLSMDSLDFEEARGAIWRRDLAAARARLATAMARAPDGAPLNDAALACLAGQAALLDGAPEQARAHLKRCASAADAAAARNTAAENDVFRARAASWLALTASVSGDPVAAQRQVDTAARVLAARRGYRTMEALGEVALAASVASTPARARDILRWIASRPEVQASGLASALLDQARCRLARRTGADARAVCQRADAEARRVAHPMLTAAYTPNARVADTRLEGR